MDTLTEKQHAHELIERLPQDQLSALVRLLETILEPNPVDEALRNAPRQAGGLFIVPQIVE